MFIIIRFNVKYTEVKIELIRDISIFNFVNSSILGGICIASQNITDDKDGVISSCDICSLYPYIMTQKLPIGNYRFIKYFNRNIYLDSNYSCLLNIFARYLLFPFFTLVNTSTLSPIWLL